MHPGPTAATAILRPWSALLSAGICLAGPLAAHAAEPISTDRPDFVESSDVVGAGRIQIETGFSSERNHAEGIRSRTRSTPTLVRLGVSDNLELRIETDGYMRSQERDQASGLTQRQRGFADASLGLKWHVRDGDEASGTPGIAWLAHLDMDSGSRAFRGQGIRPSLRAVAEWDLPHDFSIGVMPGVVADRRADGKRYAAGILAVTLGKAWTPAWRTFVEIAGQQLASRRNGGSVVTFDTGVTYLVNDAMQLDFAVSRGLNSTSPDWQWGMGVSFRF